MFIILTIGSIYIQKTGIITSTFLNDDGNDWIINSWLNIPYNNISYNLAFGNHKIQPNSYVLDDSTAMIYLSIYVWTMVLTKIMFFSPFYSRKEKKENIIMAYATPFLITMFVTVIDLGTINL